MARLGVAVWTLAAWYIPAAVRSQEPVAQAVSEARENASAIARLAKSQLDAGIVDVRVACSIVRFAHELDMAAVRVEGTNKSVQAKAKRQLIARLNEIVNHFEALFKAQRVAKMDADEAKFYWRHARAHLALIEDRRPDAKSEFDHAIRHADAVAEGKRIQTQEGVRPPNLDDALLPLRARLEYAQHFSTDRRPHLEAIIRVCETMVRRAEDRAIAGVGRALEKTYPQYHLSRARAELAAIQGKEALLHLRAAVKQAADLVEGTRLQRAGFAGLRGWDFRMVNAIRLSRDASLRLSKRTRDEAAMIRSVEHLQRLPELRAIADPDPENPFHSLVLFQALASLAELDQWVPEGATRAPSRRDDTPGSIRFHLWGKRWYRSRSGRVFYRDGSKWICVSPDD